MRSRVQSTLPCTQFTLLYLGDNVPFHSLPQRKMKSVDSTVQVRLEVGLSLFPLLNPMNKKGASVLILDMNVYKRNLTRASYLGQAPFQGMLLYSIKSDTTNSMTHGIMGTKDRGCVCQTHLGLRLGGRGQEKLGLYP